MDAAIWHPNMKLWIINFNLQVYLGKIEMLKCHDEKIISKIFLFCDVAVAKSPFKKNFFFTTNDNAYFFKYYTNMESVSDF